MRRLRWVMIPCLALSLTGVTVGPVAGQATPDAEATPATGCTVEPIELPEEMDGATPTTSELPTTGPAADPEVVAELSDVLVEVRECAASGDLARLAALFTPDGFRRVLAPEPVPIEPGTPSATPIAPVAGDPLALPVDTGVIDRAVVLEDGRVAAYVDVDTLNPQLVIFVEEDGRWLIDEILPLPVEEATPETSGSAAEVPPDVWASVVATLGITADATITVLEIEEVEWPDPSLGCPEPGASYAQVITPGYRIVVKVDGERVEVHTDLEGNAVICPAEQA